MELLYNIGSKLHVQWTASPVYRFQTWLQYEVYLTCKSEQDIAYHDPVALSLDNLIKVRDKVYSLTCYNYTKQHFIGTHVKGHANSSDQWNERFQNNEAWAPAKNSWGISCDLQGVVVRCLCKEYWSKWIWHLVLIELYH